MRDIHAEEFDEYVQEAESNLYLPQAWFARQWLQARRIKPATAKKFSLGYDLDRGSIVLPYLNALGEVRSLRWRSLERGARIKYLQPKGESLHLFRVSATRKPKVWITEGEFDCMVLEQEGFNAVGVPGVNAFKEEWAYLFAYCDEVTVVFDGDEAGLEGTRKLARALGPFVDKLRMVRLPEGEDINDLYIRSPKEMKDLVS